jgi:hypothetical protein
VTRRCAPLHGRNLRSSPSPAFFVHLLLLVAARSSNKSFGHLKKKG